MILNIRKLSTFTLLCTVTAIGTIPQGIYSHTTAPEITQKEHDILHASNNKIHTLTIRAKFLVSKLENPSDPDTLDWIVRKMQSLEPSINALENEIVLNLDNPGETEKTDGVFYDALEIKLEIIKKIRFILNKLAIILENGLKNAVPPKGLSPIAYKFWNQVKGPLAQLAAPAELNYFESKLNTLHSLIEEVNFENASIIKELLFLLQKIRVITESNGTASYTAVSKKLPKKRAPFAGIPAKIDLEDWIGEMQNKI